MAVHGFTLHKMLPALVLLTNAVGLVNSAAVTAPSVELSSPEPTILTKTVHMLGNHTTYTTSSGETTLVLVNIPPETKAQTSASKLATGGVSLPAQSMASNLPSVTTTTTTTEIVPSITQRTTMTIIANGTEIVAIGEPASASEAPARGSPVETSTTAPSMRTTTITIHGPSQIDSTSTLSVPASSTSSTASSSGSSDSTAVTSPPVSTSQPSESETETSHSSIILTPPFPPPDTTDFPPFPPPDTTDPPSSTKETKFPFDNTSTDPWLGGTATNVETITVVSTSTIVELGPSVSTPSATTSQSYQPGGPPNDVNGSEPCEFHYSFTNIEMIIGQIASLFSGPKLQPLPNLAPIAGQKCMAQGGDIRCCHFEPEALASDLYFHVVCPDTPLTFCPVEMMYCCSNVEGVDGQSSHAAGPSCVPIEVPEVNPPGFPPVSPPAGTGSPPDSTGSPLDSTGYPSDSAGSPSTTTSFPAFSSGNGEPPAETTDPSITTPAGSPHTSTSGYGSITSFPVTPPSSGNGGSGSSEPADSLDTEVLSELLDKISIISECIESAWEDDDGPSETGSSPSGGTSMTTTKVTSSSPSGEVDHPISTPPGSLPSPQPANGSAPAEWKLECCEGNTAPVFYKTLWNHCEDDADEVAECDPKYLYHCLQWQARCEKVHKDLVRAEVIEPTAATAIIRDVSPASDNIQPRGELRIASIKYECCKGNTASEFWKTNSNHCKDDSDEVKACDPKYLYYCHDKHCAKDYMLARRRIDPAEPNVEAPEPMAGSLTVRDVSAASQNVASALSAGTTLAVTVIKTSTNTRQLARPTTNLPPPHDFFMQTQRECIETGGTVECCPSRKKDHFFKTGSDNCSVEEDDLEACLNEHLYCCKPYRPGVAPQYRTMCNRFQYLDPIDYPIIID